MLWRGAAIATPFVLQRALDDGVVAENQRVVVTWCLVLIGLGVVAWVADAMRHLFVDRGSYRAVFALRHAGLEALLDADPDAASRYAPGEVISRVVDDCMRVRIWVSGSVTGIIAAMTLVVVALLVARLDPLLAVVALAVVPLSVLLAVTQSATNTSAATRTAGSVGQNSAWIDTSISGVATIKGLGAESIVIERSASRASDVRITAVALSVVRARWIASATAIPGMGVVVGLLVGGSRAIDGAVSVGELVAFTSWMGLIASSTGMLTVRLALRASAVAAAERIGRLIALPAHPAALPEPTDPALQRKQVPSGAIEVVDVAIDRGGRRLLEGIELRVERGEWVGVIGPTGSGKSSLLRAVVGDVRVASGTITLGGDRVDTIAWPLRTERAALVPQAPTIMTGSIAEVIRRAAPDVDDQRIEELLTIAQLTDLAADLGGLDGRIGERGRTLSGGQRQRMSLMIALACERPVLVLDDITSALDEAVEADLLEALRTQTRNSAVLLATHRGGPRHFCDRVIDLADFAASIHAGDPL